MVTTSLWDIWIRPSYVGICQKARVIAYVVKGEKGYNSVLELEHRKMVNPDYLLGLSLFVMPRGTFVS